MLKPQALLIILQIFVYAVFGQHDIYRAAVLEYAAKLAGPTPADHVRENTQEYGLHMEQAARQGAQIIVFPEYGLTGWDIPADKLDQVSTRVPNPTDNISPCVLYQQNPLGYSNYSKFLVDLSCAARSNRIYSVVNLVEWHHEENDNKKLFYNTNIALDRNGRIIARYRKINLYEEPHFTPGSETNSLSTFKTDFGITFGMFICSDILFKVPALNLVDNPLVTDVIFSTAWFSELPFYGASSVQHGYAKSNGVNLLAAGLNDPAVRVGGSGIYLADGRIMETYVSGTKGSKLLIQNVPKLRSRKNLSNTCQGASQTPYQYQTSGLNLFSTKKSDLNHYTFKALNLDNVKGDISETVCAGKSSFCCSFNISVNRGPVPNYVYKLVAFHGAKKFSTKTLGQRNCGLVACENDNADSCGGRLTESPTVTFERISVKGTFDSKNSHEQPSTLNFDLRPSTEYMYCTKTSNNQVEIHVQTTKPHDSLLTFGIIGRVFDHDNQSEGPINGALLKGINVYVVLSISIFIFLQQE